jgi:hypothetical protein
MRIKSLIIRHKVVSALVGLAAVIVVIVAAVSFGGGDSPSRPPLSQFWYDAGQQYAQQAVQVGTPVDCTFEAHLQVGTPQVNSGVYSFIQGCQAGGG